MGQAPGRQGFGQLGQQANPQATDVMQNLNNQGFPNVRRQQMGAGSGQVGGQQGQPQRRIPTGSPGGQAPPTAGIKPMSIPGGGPIPGGPAAQAAAMLGQQMGSAPSGFGPSAGPGQALTSPAATKAQTTTPYQQTQQRIGDFTGQQRDAFTTAGGAPGSFQQFNPERGAFAQYERGPERHDARLAARDDYYAKQLQGIPSTTGGGMTGTADSDFGNFGSNPQQAQQAQQAIQKLLQSRQGGGK